MKQLFLLKQLPPEDIILSDGKTLSWLYRKGNILEREDDDEYAHLKVELSPIDWERFKKQQNG